VWTDKGTVTHTFRQSYRCVDRQMDTDVCIFVVIRCVDRQNDSDTYIQAVIQMCGQTDGH